MFGDDIRAIVPQIAMFAGTMLACSCKKILMCKRSNLGPIDPQLGGMPAFGAIQEFQRASEEIKLDPSKANVWHPIISQYKPSFLSQCENAIKGSNEFAQSQLETVMFKGRTDRKQLAKIVVQRLSD